MINNKSEINVKNKYNNNNESITNLIIKINEILGNDFEIIEINDNSEHEFKNDKIVNYKLINYKFVNYKFINKSQIKNVEKSKYIKEKIELFKKK